MSRSTQNRLPLPRILPIAALLLAASLVATAQPTNPVKLMKGVVTDVRSGKPVDGGRIFVYQGSAKDPVAQSRINPGTGAFQVVLGPATDYRFVLRSNRFMPFETTVRTPDGSNYEEVVRNLTMEPIPVGRTLYSGRLFDANASVLRTDGELAKAIAFMRESQAATVKITVIPDGAPSKGAKKTAAPPKKKGKKGAAAPVETSVAAAPAAGEADALVTLAQARMQALKAMMQKEGISLTRITWEVPANAAEARALAGRRENVVIAINGIDVEEVEED